MNPIDMRRRSIDEFQMEHATVHVLESVDEKVKAMVSEIEDTKNDNEHGGFAHLPPRTVTNLVTKLLPLRLVSDALSNGKRFYFLLG